MAVASHPSVEAFKTMIPEFEELTGIQVTLDEMEEGQLGQKLTMPIGARYLEIDTGDHRSMIGAAMRWSGGVPPIRLSGAPSTLAMTAFRQPSRTLVHLVDSVRDEIMRPITEVAVSDSVDLSWRLGSGRLSIALGPFRHHALIVVGDGSRATPVLDFSAALHG